MATLIPNGRQVFLDLDGKPLNGGLVFFFVPGTTQFRDTFQDPGATQKNTNPVVLDAAGTATIFGVGVYRQVLKDAEGSLIWDRLTADTSAAFASWAGTATGSVNHIGLTVLNFTSADGQAVDFIAAYTNTGPIDVSTNGAPAIPTQKDSVNGPVALTGGEIVAGNVYRVTYDAAAGVFHLSYLFDRAYVDSEDAAVLAAAKAYAAGQASSALTQANAYAAQQASAAQIAAQAYAAQQASAAQSAAQSYAQNAANNAQAAAINAAAQDATNKANAAQNAANAYTNQVAANTTAEAHGYADTVSNNAYNNANAYTNQVSYNTTADAHSYADNAAANAQANAVNYAANSDAQFYAQAKAYADNSASNAQAAANANTYQNYVASMRFAGQYSASGGGRLNGSVVIGTAGSTDVYKYVQKLVNGQWLTIDDA